MSLATSSTRASNMVRPVAYLLRMLAFLAAVGGIAVALEPALKPIFLHNPYLNGLILLILLLGIIWNIRQVTRLEPEVRWLISFRRDQAPDSASQPRLLAPMASMLVTRAASTTRPGEKRFTLSASAMRSVLDTIASRLDESRELSRYMTGLLIFLGLLGTFWGLLRTIGGVSDVISGMSVNGSGDVNMMFEQLKSGLARPIAGMGTAFSASMFGLSGALVLGFLDLTAGQAQNRFFNELEEWLAGLTRLSSGALGTDGEGSVPVYVQALLEQTAENMERLQQILARGEENRQASHQALLALTERIGSLSDTVRTGQQVMVKIAEAQTQLTPVLRTLNERYDEERSLSELLQTHMRAVETLLQRQITEAEQGRIQSTAELRNDLRILTRTVGALADDAQG
ncbi:MotA/TolQ/ExbB proton channel family [Granulibacter bethesdensis]|uniref:MotA/TolQ/ExbB proton channel family n=1 Tax=Granulibacter bethesdensis TaxID=364410 RepID=A0AAC9K6Z6_9PROT|nr:flagellar motor protein MotA [Granulibacter bethesdensis]APH54361.1 MotA/TolQ/ExbB proton channel family [Granulibacter bethesdensis]APH61946.1 MotA/TolQ/ExbB proton channel family [Granulibacter bethesdensis]